MSFPIATIIDDIRDLQHEQAVITNRILHKELELHQFLATTLEPYDHSIPDSVDSMLADALHKMNGVSFTTDTIISYLHKKYPTRTEVIDKGIHTALYHEQRRGGLTRLEARLWQRIT